MGETVTAGTSLPPVTVNILTGFLGSGKTSLLKRLLYVAAAGLAGAVLCLIAGIAVSMF